LAAQRPGTARRHHEYSDWKEPMVSIARRMDPDDPVRQAPNTVAFYLEEAIDVIDRKFCPGYAAQHPELVGAFVQATAMDHVARRIADSLQALAWTG
jgi:hypothetical protein